MTRDKVEHIVGIVDRSGPYCLNTKSKRERLALKIADECNMHRALVLEWIHDLYGLDLHIEEDRLFLFDYLLNM